MDKHHDLRTRISLEPHRLRFKLLQLKREALFTDIVLLCHGKSLHVHKCILSASSIFFKLLFTDTKLEPLQTYDLSSVVKLENFERLECIINYMYSGEIHLSEENIVATASLSCFFSMNDLTGFCSNYLNRILSVTNCLKLYLGMRQFEQHFQAATSPVTVHRQTEIQDRILELLVSSLYNEILLQEPTLQVSTNDMQHLLSLETTKNFCVENILEFVTKWLKLHTDRDSVKVVDILVSRVHEWMFSVNGQEESTKKLNKMSGSVHDIENLLKGMKLPDELKTNMSSKLAELLQELDIKTRDEESLEVTQIKAGKDSVKVDSYDSKIEDECRTMDESENTANTDLDSDTVENEDIITPNVEDEDLPTAKVKTSHGNVKLKVQRNLMDTEEIKMEQEIVDERGKRKPGLLVRINTKKRRNEGNKRVVQKNEEVQEEERDAGERSQEKVLDSSPKDDKQLVNEISKTVKNANGKFGCPLCSKEFKKKSSLVLHANTHTGSKPYRCVECGMVFYRSYHVIRHMKQKHSNKANFECDVCQKEFSDPKEMVAHWNTHNKELFDNGQKNVHVKNEYTEIKVSDTGKREYWCKVCNKKFSRHSHLKEHVMIHTGDRPFKCDTCKTSYKSKYELNKHINSFHLGLHAKYKCENCKRPFNMLEAYEKHIEKCAWRSFNCDKCNASFHRSYHLRRHLVVHAQDKLYPCPSCNKKFQQEIKLKAHMKSHEGQDVGKRSAVCDICGTILKDAKYLKRHLISHTGVKAHKCPVCLKTYSQAAGLQVHMRTHTGVKPYQCEICSMMFSVKSNLMRHQRRHRGDRRHKCDQCGKGFVMMSDLKRHYTMHTGEKNFACRYCGKKFSSNSKLPQHERIHTGEKPYECRVCGKRFIQSGDRTRHESIHGMKAPVKSRSLSLHNMTNNSDTENPQIAVSNEPIASAESGSDMSDIHKIISSVTNRFVGIDPESSFQDQSRSSSDIASRETSNNNSVNIQGINRRPVIRQEDILNSQSKTSSGLNHGSSDGSVVSVPMNNQVQPGVSCGQPALAYLAQNQGMPSSSVQNDTLIRDMYTVSSAYTSQTSTSNTFFNSLAENNFMHY